MTKPRAALAALTTVALVGLAGPAAAAATPAHHRHHKPKPAVQVAVSATPQQVQIGDMVVFTFSITGHQPNGLDLSSVRGGMVTGGDADWVTCTFRGVDETGPDGSCWGGGQLSRRDPLVYTIIVKVGGDAGTKVTAALNVESDYVNIHCTASATIIPTT